MKQNIFCSTCHNIPRECVCVELPKPYDPIEHNADYERGFIDGQQKQIESAVHRMVTAMGTPTYHIPSKEKEWVGLTDEEYIEMWGGTGKPLLLNFFRKIEAKLKEKNYGNN